MATYRFFDGVAGRPGAGSSSGVVLPSAPAPYSGDYSTGIVFSVSGGGRWLDGYWWYVPFGGQTTSGATFALWEVYNPSAGLLIAGSGVTAGTLTAATTAGNANGWNYIPLPAPLQLTPNVVYQAVIAYSSSAGFPQQKNVFGSGDTFSAGFTNNWATCFSSSGGSNPPTGPGGTLLPQMPYDTATTNASAAMPTINDSDDILWIDVQLDDSPPPGYTTRLWPNYPYVYGMFANSVDSEFTLCNEFDISATCALLKLWFYSPQGPPAATALPTQCGIFNIATGLNVPGSLVTSPSWSGAAGSGWVSVAYAGSGLVLPAGNYLPWVTYAGGNPWYGTIVGYYTSGGQGASGITNGIVTAPSNANAHGPSQGTYSTSYATYPNVVVTNGENYFVDLEVNPVAAPDIPLGLPRVPHPKAQRVTAGRTRVASGVRGLLNHAVAAIPLWRALPRRPGPQRARAGSRGLLAAGVAGAVAVAVVVPSGTPPRAYPVSHPQPQRAIARGISGPGNHAFAPPPGVQPQIRHPQPQRALWRGLTAPPPRPGPPRQPFLPPRIVRPQRALWRGGTGAAVAAVPGVAVPAPRLLRQPPRRVQLARAAWRVIIGPGNAPPPVLQNATSNPTVTQQHTGTAAVTQAHASVAAVTQRATSTAGVSGG